MDFDGPDHWPVAKGTNVVLRFWSRGENSLRIQSIQGYLRALKSIFVHSLTIYH